MKTSSIKVVERQVFREGYLRGNRECDSKDLVCFPRCSWLGHVACNRKVTKGRGSMVCGTEVTILFDINFEDIGGCKDDLLVLGEIVKEGDPSPFQEQSLVQLSDVEKRIVLDDVKEPAQRTMYEAKLVEILQESYDESCERKKIRANIFATKGGFKYAWKSSRWTCESRHTFEWTILQKVENEDSYLVLMVHRPPSDAPGSHFCVLSTRGKRCHEQNERRRHLLKAATTSEGTYWANNFPVQSRRVSDDGGSHPTIEMEVDEKKYPQKRKISSMINYTPSDLIDSNFVIENEYFDSFLLKKDFSDYLKRDFLFPGPYQTQCETSQVFERQKKDIKSSHFGANIDFGLSDNDIEKVSQIIRTNFAHMS